MSRLGSWCGRRFLGSDRNFLTWKDFEMSKVRGLIGVIVVAVAGYFGLNAAGIIGGPAELTAEELAAGLSTNAEEINSEDGVRFDDWSRLVSARHIERTITIRGETLMDMADLSEGYFESRAPQIANKLCNDEALRPVLAGATFNFNWFSKDEVSLGDMITVRGDEICAEAGY